MLHLNSSKICLHGLPTELFAMNVNTALSSEEQLVLYRFNFLSFIVWLNSNVVISWIFEFIIRKFVNEVITHYRAETISNK